jgi:aminopeptidase
MSRVLLTILSIIAVVALLSCQQGPQPAQPANVAENKTSPEPAKTAAPVDYEALANRIVTQSAGVKEGDIVLVAGGVRDFELLEDLNTDVRKVGAFPFLTVGSDRMLKKYYEEVPAKYDSQFPDLDSKIANMVGVVIGVDSSETEDALANAPKERVAAVGKAQEPIGDIFLKRNVRQVSIGNDLYPTAWRASHYGISQDELAKTFWNAVNTDYSSVQVTGERVKTSLSTGKELHITDPAGTDLKMRIDARPFFVSDGIISPEDVKTGGPAVSVFLPAGEVYCAPVAASAAGKVVVAKDYFQGKEMNNLTFTFVGGKLTSMTGSGPGFEAFKAFYDAEGAGKDLFGFVDFGINPNLKLWPTAKIGNWIQSGMVTVGLGNNTFAGGDNKISYGTAQHIPGATVTLDGKTIVENGTLKL